MEKLVRVAINGFGRIGRLVFRRAAREGGIKFVAVNDLEDKTVLAHLLRHDTTHGKFNCYINSKGYLEITDLYSSDMKILVISVKELEKLPWKDLDIDIVVEATGRFTERKDLLKHLEAGAKKVILTATAKNAIDVDTTIVMGVNEKVYNPARDRLISNASCTTNCLAPVAKALHEKFGIVKGWMSTIHAYTNDQRLLDLAHKDLRRARAASENFMPASTGAAKAIGLIIPELQGRLNGSAWRVPVKDVSSIDLVVELQKEVTAEEVNAALEQASLGQDPRFLILDYTTEELVSSDYIGNPHSAIVDAKCTQALGNMVRIVAWYDNEWAYSCRVVDLIKYIAKRGL